MARILFIQGEETGRVRPGVIPDRSQCLRLISRASHPSITFAAEKSLVNRHTLRRLLSFEPELIVNSITNADTQARALVVAEDLCKRMTLPVVNAPAAVARNTRHQTADALFGIPGLVVPRCRFFDVDPVREITDAIQAGELRLPLIVRRAGAHAGTETVLALSEKDVADAIRKDRGQVSVHATEFHEYRTTDSYWAKYRAFIVDGEVYPYHARFSNHWNIHAANAVPFMNAHPELLERDAAFVRQPEIFLPLGAIAALRRVGPALGLDVIGIDFSTLPSGELLFFEANGSMSMGQQINADREENRVARARIVQALARMVVARSPAATC